jgi:hypothetical protein
MCAGMSVTPTCSSGGKDREAALDEVAIRRPEEEDVIGRASLRAGEAAALSAVNTAVSFDDQL